MPIIEHFSGFEVLDSRGRPTVLATCTLAGNVTASASVPSGASTGAAEALELRDGDLTRYRGLGCRNAVRNITEIILPRLRGKSFHSQHQLDQSLLELDG